MARGGWRMNARRRRLWYVAMLILAAASFHRSVWAHCDGMDGPVVQSVQEALATGKIELILIWVQGDDEAEVRKAFARAQSVGELSPEARALASRYLIETVVRLHRAGEGAPYTGLKPAGRDLGPAIPLADQALATGDVAPLVELITAETRKGITERFSKVVQAARHAPDDVRAGREYVRSYVEFIHYAERAYGAASRPAPGHFPEQSRAADEHDP